MPDAASGHIVTGRGPRAARPGATRGAAAGTRRRPAGARSRRSGPVARRGRGGRGAPDPGRSRPRRGPGVPLTGRSPLRPWSLLAGGFGMLGGRPAGRRLAAGRRAGGGSPPRAEPLRAAARARVTPWAACGAVPDEPPVPVLEVDGADLGPGRAPDVRPGHDLSPDPPGSARTSWPTRRGPDGRHHGALDRRRGLCGRLVDRPRRVRRPRRPAILEPGNATPTRPSAPRTGSSSSSRHTRRPRSCARSSSSSLRGPATLVRSMSRRSSPRP